MFNDDDDVFEEVTEEMIRVSLLKAVEAMKQNQRSGGGDAGDKGK